MSDLEKQLEVLLERIAALEAEVLRLRAENEELRRRLGLTSKNSHKPPSSDGYGKKSVRPGLPKSGKKSAGGQKGHKGKTLRQVEKPDKVEVHLPRSCSICGRSIDVEEAHQVIGQRQVFDLPDPKLEVIEHHLCAVACCGQAQSGVYPAHVKSSVQYGPGVRALVTKLSVDHKMPLEQISTLFEDMYGYDLNSETIEKALERGYELSATLETGVKSALQDASVGHFDETGLRVAGKLYWMHTVGNDDYTHLFIHTNRGKKALLSEQSVLKDFRGFAIHDSLAAYFSFTDAQHGLCNAHILRELQALMDGTSKWAAEMHALLLELHAELPNRRLAEDAADFLRQRYRQILQNADVEEPPPKKKAGKGRPKNTPGRNLLNRLSQYESAVLAFAFVNGVPFTNNLAERDLRPAKVKQKVSGGFRTVHGAVVYARLQAVISTARKQDRNIFAFLRDLFTYQPLTLLAG
jgi:transposase